MKNTNGQESYKEFFSPVLNRNLIQYEYKTLDGRVFSTVVRNLEHARQQKEEWLKEKH